MAPEPATGTRWDNSHTTNHDSRLFADNLNTTPMHNELQSNNYQQTTVPTESYSNADIKSIIATNKKLSDELLEFKKQSQQLSKQSTTDPTGRDATKTDTVADVEFAEAALSRRASVIAKEKGLALIPALRTIELRLLTAVDTEQGGKFKALVTTDVWDAGFANVGIPAGTLARGTIGSAVNDGCTRISMTITEFVLPSGDLVQLRVADAVTDSHGVSGPKGNVNHKWFMRFGSTVVCGVLGAASSLGSKRNNNNNNNNSNEPLSLNVAIRQNLASEFGAQGIRSFESGMHIKPTISLREGANIAMILGSSLYLVPWERLRITIAAPNKRLVH
jgi:type IV secretory pathway VirB10-like protein